MFAEFPAAIVVLDRFGTVVEVNQQASAILGVSLAARRWRDVVAEIVLVQPGDGPDVSLRNGAIVNIVTQPSPDRDGQILVVFDVSERRRLQDQNARLQKVTEVSQTLAGLVHQLRTPLAAAMLNASVLPASAVRDRLRRQLRDLEGLISGFLQCADTTGQARSGGAGQAHSQSLGVTHIALDALASDVVREQSEQRSMHASRASSSEDGVGVRSCFEDVGGARRLILASVADAWVVGNESALRSALHTLLNNAFESTEGPITVCVNVMPSDSGAVDGVAGFAIACRDSGPGIAPGDRAHVFESFYSTKTRGNGLGLPVTRMILQAHGGSLDLTCATPGNTCFEMTLPAAPSTASEESKQQLETTE
jgi:two-component system sensor histidine kinase FlrB